MLINNLKQKKSRTLKIKRTVAIHFGAYFPDKIKRLQLKAASC